MRGRGYQPLKSGDNRRSVGHPVIKICTHLAPIDYSFFDILLHAKSSRSAMHVQDFKSPVL